MGGLFPSFSTHHALITPDALVKSSIPSVLLIDGNLYRIRLLYSWMPLDLGVVTVESASKAVGVLRQDNKEHVYTGIVLDHELPQESLTNSDRFPSGFSVVCEIIRNVSRDTPILLHSMNVCSAPITQSMLEKAGFSVARIPMVFLTRERLWEWLRNECDQDALQIDKIHTPPGFH